MRYYLQHSLRLCHGFGFTPRIILNRPEQSLSQRIRNRRTRSINAP